MRDRSLLVEERAAKGGLRLGYVTLSNPASLNAISLGTAALLDEALCAWAEDPGIACVVLSGSGERAFCAGGDLRKIYQAIRSGDSSFPSRFFIQEYRVVGRIHAYPKPILCWGDGIVYGGGLGLLAAASHRVVTEKSRLAMPEISIGLFPDVGGSWFLGRMPGRIGLFLALTGLSVAAGDALFLKLADYFLPAEERMSVLEERLASLSWTGQAEADRLLLARSLREWARRWRSAVSPARTRLEFDRIQSLTEGDTLPEIADKIAYGPVSTDPWFTQGAENFAEGCPLSSWLIWELSRRTVRMSLKEVIRLEAIVAHWCGARADFPEGIRALLIDKDRNPRWSDKDIAAVPAQKVKEQFVAPWPPEEHPLRDL
ncbi:enoyl-CoA hydratase/isomerase family protein [Methylacidimicrobium tartarophylax]|uniref:3-hydroxyisobutyryl-CoA hydrolase n=1 Tax=Methylacidimicrobium tartarophylax TaxID=1041768 RepID=A0A5E6MCH8_9BACT|nr:enoyl-CoA hydratase/isomerase family protein [Methylacidimicrobium tartarophylax]VVM05980.1 enoyl-CoA hydratase [Methylacidimicrobium tartarophylax]